ncbi:MAG: glycerophosphodiester phosphodiesterase family protein [Bacteroidetes bacterium]|nr:glycerophosphodiester phosphodiesterase family protein [Bacteroidota bacterium]
MDINTIDGKPFDLQGHRGARGLLPENTIPAFLLALDIGVTTLEMDAAISRDGEVILSHEPWFSAAICSHADGSPVTPEEEKSLIIFEMTAAEVAQFDCGLRGHPGFPEQQPMAVFKPRLKEVITAVNERVATRGLVAPRYNIEIKSSPEGDEKYHPSPEEFARQLYEVLKAFNLLQMADVQSFDARALEAMHAIDPSVRLVWLIANEDGVDTNLAKLTFLPDIYSPNFNLVDSVMVSSLHQKGVKVVPWTVNDPLKMKELIELGIDGLITDYPDRGKALIEELNK